jgi:hypothetical protein
MTCYQTLVFGRRVVWVIVFGVRCWVAWRRHCVVLFDVVEFEGVGCQQTSVILLLRVAQPSTIKLFINMVRDVAAK